MTDFRALCEELLDWAERTSSHYYTQPDVILRARAALAQPEPQGPTNEELITMWATTRYIDQPEGGLAYARAVLARYGRPAIEPVPVSERLPGPEDCTADEECWYWDLISGCWFFLPGRPLNDHYSHWLPYWALPVPGVEGE